MIDKYYIITADDYGMCSVVEKAIDDCIEAGLVTTTNVIVNMGDLSAASTLRKRYPNISVGMHWNITAGKPICNPSEIKSLVDVNGNFFKPKEFFARYHKKLIKDQDIIRELKAQYACFQKICGNADYWNSHQNSALDFKTFQVFNKTALSLGITKTRSFRRTYVADKRIPGGLKGRFVEVLKKIVFNIWFGHIIPKSGTKLPDGRMIYFDDNQKSEDIKNIADNVIWGDKKIVEMVVHPAITADYPYFGTLREVRVKEWKMFSSKSTIDYLTKHHIGVCNFDIVK